MAESPQSATQLHLRDVPTLSNSARTPKVQVAWSHSIRFGKRLNEEACAGKPQAGFCEGEAPNDIRSNIVTLLKPKGESNGEHKASLNIVGVLSTRHPIESTFATVRLRTDKTRGCVSALSILSLVFKLVQSAQKRWLKIRGFKHLAQVIEGVKFQDGIAIAHSDQSTSKNAA